MYPPFLLAIPPFLIGVPPPQIRHSIWLVNWTIPQKRKMICMENRLRGLQGEKTTWTRDYKEGGLHTTRRRNYMDKDYTEEGTTQKTEKDYMGRDYMGRDYTGTDYMGRDYSEKDSTGRDYTWKDYIEKDYTEEGLHYTKGELYGEETT